MKILSFHITADFYFYIKIGDDRKLYGSGADTDYKFIPLKELTIDRKEKLLYEQMEEHIKSLPDEKSVVAYVERECRKKDLYVSRHITKKEYDKKYL